MVKGWLTEVRKFAYTHVCIMANVRDPPINEGQTAKTCTQGSRQLADNELAADQPL
jgi:hypothetical protein